MLTRTLSFLALGAGLVLTTAACSDATSAPSAASAATPTTSAASTTSAAPATSAAPTASAAPAGAKQVCPVSRATLIAAMKTDKNGASQLRQGATLGKPECYAGYVLVTKTSIKDAKGKPVADDEIGNFTYESGSWKYQGASTGGFCEGMPADARKHFETHFHSGCG